MSRRRFLKTAIVLISFLLTIFTVLTGEHFRKTEKIELGSVATKRYTAPRKIENIFATERKREEARKSIEPLYKEDPKIKEDAIAKLEVLFTKIKEAKEYIEKEDSTADNTVNNEDTNTIESENNIQEISKEEKMQTAIDLLRTQSPIPLLDKQYKLLIEMELNNITELKSKCIDILESTYDIGIREETKTKTILDVKGQFDAFYTDEETSNLGYDIVASLIQPNNFIDEIATNKMIEESLKQVEPVMILQGQKIVDEGEIITEEIYSILDSLGYIQKDFREEAIKYVGVILLICLLQSFIYIYIWFFNKTIMKSLRSMLLLFSIYCIIIIIIRSMTPLHFAWIPIPIAGMLLAVLLDVRIGIIINGYISIIGALINKEGIDFLMFFIIVGTIFPILVTNIYKRSRILWMGFIAGMISGITLISIQFFLIGAYSAEIIYSGFYGILSGVLAVIITAGSLPFWEVAFDVVTPIKLMELTNPDQHLLKRLLIEAPGTYHHSLLVANLAETAATDIGANSLLARVGGYYHDIGKLAYPQYFKENQMMENPHDYMEPSVSSKILQQHISNGIKIASEYKLPRPIRDIIRQHHGTSIIQFFYYKALKNSSAEEVKKEDYTYQGIIPQTKEAALVMLADTVEAAVRSMDPQNKNKEETEKLIRKLIKDKLDDGQLNDSDLTIKDMETIVQSFMKVFNGMYHERIKYPDKIEEKENEYFNRKQRISAKRESKKASK